MISLESERLIIRDHVETDLESFHHWISDPEIIKIKKCEIVLSILWTRTDFL